MRTKTALLLALLSAAGLAGCVSPNPQQAQVAETGSAQASRLLQGFQEAMRAKDAWQLRPLVAPTMSPSDFIKTAIKVEAASWLPSYAGYTLDIDRTVARVSWRKWNEGPLLLAVPGKNADGDGFEDAFALAQGQNGWYIKDFTVRQPVKGDVVSPPAAVVGQIQPQATRVMTQLATGQIEDLYFSLPDDPALKYRMPQVGFWQRLSMSSPPAPISIYEDMRVLRMLRISSWPDVSQPPELTWLDYGALLAAYEVPYAWASESEPQVLRVELTFIKQGNDWTFQMIRLFGEAIPYS